ncbi:MAG: hypothetical protein KAS32_16165 [Candidatus Peribacteraceae bacterium]|nr:hypothetical protein [Candidatus Peribacteraceae bacterium]
MFEKKPKVLTINNFADLCDVKSGLGLNGDTKRTIGRKKIHKEVAPIVKQAPVVEPKIAFVAPEKPKIPVQEVKAPEPTQYKNFSRISKPPKKNKPKIKTLPSSKSLKRLEFGGGDDITWL